MSDEIDPKDTNLAMAFTLQIAAMAIKVRDIDMHIASHPGMLDEYSMLKMAEAVERVERALAALRMDLIIERKPQAWGPCHKCGGAYRFETLGSYGMDAFKVTTITCVECGFSVKWQDDPEGDTARAWRRAREKAASDKLAATMAKLKAAGPPPPEEVETQMRASAEFKKKQDEQDLKR